MHLIRNKSAGNFQSSSVSKFTNSSQNSLSKKNINKPISKNQKQTSNTVDKSGKSLNAKGPGLVARALSSAKSTIQKLLPSSKLINEQKIHIIANKYVYNVEDLIGKGFSSHVYKGSCIKNRQTKNYAIKVLDLAKIKGFLLDLLKKQIQIHKSLNHPNIVKCYDAIQTETQIYLIQEYCSGEDLAQFINQRKGNIPEGQVLSIMSQIAEGYKYLIQQKILHRDLKPCNIFRCKMNQKWKIGDFGFSCKSNEEPDEINVGTPIYMPPQSLEKTFYSHKSDLFSLGVIMYEVIYGKVPWYSKSESLLLKKMKESKIDFESEKRSINSPLIKRFIERCCQIELEKRMSQEQFIQIELYPRTPNQAKQSRGRSSAGKERLAMNCTLEKIHSSGIKLSQSIGIQEMSPKIEQISNYPVEKVMLKIKQSILGVKSIQSKVQLKTQIKDQSIYSRQKSHTSQYSTQSKERVNHQDVQNQKLNQIFRTNNETLQKQNSFCKHLYFMIKNIDTFLLVIQIKELLTIVMYRHIIYLLKRLKNDKFNYFQLLKWESYRLSNDYSAFHKEVTINLQRMEGEYFRSPKRKNIRIQREVDSKFKQFDLQSEFTLKFYLKITQWLKQLIREFKLSLINTAIQAKVLNNQGHRKYVSNINQIKRINQSHSSIIRTSLQKNTPLKNNKSQKQLQNSQQPSQASNSSMQPITTGQKIKARAQKNNWNDDKRKEMKEDKVFYSSLSSNQLQCNLKTCPDEQQSKTFSDLSKIKINEDLSVALKKAYLQQKQKDTAKSSSHQAQLSSFKDQSTKTLSGGQFELNEAVWSGPQPELLSFKQKQDINDIQYGHLANATLQALLSLLQYYYWMEQKITSSQDMHKKFNIHTQCQQKEKENIFSLVRQYSKANFRPQDIEKIKSLAKSF